MREVYVFEGRPDDVRQVIEEKFGEGFEILHIQSFAGSPTASTVVYFTREA